MKAQPASELSTAPEASSRARRRQRIAAAAMSVALVCSGTTSCTRTQIVLSSAAIAAVVAGTAVGVTYAVKHHNHTMQGCVFSDANGLKLRANDAKVYTLKGETASIKVGDKVNFHGSKMKKVKGDSASDQVFEVQKVNKDYGPCSTSVATSPAQ